MNLIAAAASAKVIHVCPHSAQLSGGHTNAILTYMEGQRRHGLDIHGICPLANRIPPNMRVPANDLPIDETDFDAAEFPATAMKLAPAGQTALFHFHGFVRQYLPLGRALERARMPYVLTSQGQLHYRDPLHWAKKFVYLNFMVRLFRRAAGLHFVTRRERTRCAALLPFWTKPVLVQQNVVEVPDPDQVAAVPRSDFQLPARAVVFAYLGRLHIAHKGLDLLLRGFAELLRSDQDGAPPITDGGPFLVLIGPDWQGDRQRLEHLSRQLGCTDRVRFLGPRVGVIKWQLLKMADAFISPSRWDACPSAVTEAVGFGLPTIVSSTMNPAPELAEANAAVAAKPTPKALAEAMRQFVIDAESRRSLGQRGRRWVQENCSLAVAGARFETFYTQVLGDAPSAACTRPGLGVIPEG